MDGTPKLSLLPAKPRTRFSNAAAGHIAETLCGLPSEMQTRVSEMVDSFVALCPKEWDSLLPDGGECDREGRDALAGKIAAEWAPNVRSGEGACRMVDSMMRQLSFDDRLHVLRMVRKFVGFVARGGQPGPTIPPKSGTHLDRIAAALEGVPENSKGVVAGLIERYAVRRTLGIVSGDPKGADEPNAGQCAKQLQAMEHPDRAAIPRFPSAQRQAAKLSMLMHPYNLSAVARTLGWSKSRIYAVVRRGRDPNIDEAMQLSQHLGMTVEKVFGEESED